MSVGPNGSLNGFIPSPGDVWHQDISAAPLDPNSDKIINTSGDLANSKLHPDFSSIAGGNYGIPYNVVDSSQTPLTPVAITRFLPDSDIMLAPIPSDALIEGNPAACATTATDRHMLIVDRKKCVVYEYWQAASCSTGWNASNTAVWDLSGTGPRPYGLTSADAAGLSIFEGLVRYDEIISGSIQHALRFSAQKTNNNAYNGHFVAPATHAAGNLYASDNMMGMRIRLKKDFDISGFSTTNQIILKAMKQYGMILADNGSNMYFQGTPDARWNDTDLNYLKRIPSTEFEVVQMATPYDSASAPKGAAPTISSFTASATTVAAGTEVTLKPVVSNATYSYIDNGGFVRGNSVTVKPTSTTTYKLSSRNAFGTSTASVTIAVNGSTPAPAAPTVTTPTIKPTLQLSMLKATNYLYSAVILSNSAGATSLQIISGHGGIIGPTVTVTGTEDVVVQVTQGVNGKYLGGTATAVIPKLPASEQATSPTNAPKLQFSLTKINAKLYVAAYNSDSPGALTLRVMSGHAGVLGNVITPMLANETVVLQVSQAASGKFTAATAQAQIKP